LAKFGKDIFLSRKLLKQISESKDFKRRFNKFLWLILFARQWRANQQLSGSSSSKDRANNHEACKNRSLDPEQNISVRYQLHAKALF